VLRICTRIEISTALLGDDNYELARLKATICEYTAAIVVFFRTAFWVEGQRG